MRFVENYQEARMVWRQLLTDDEVRSFANDYAQHKLRGEDIEDAVAEFKVRWPGKSLGRGRGNSINASKNLPAVPKNKHPRCEDHTEATYKQMRDCVSCLALRDAQSPSALEAPSEVGLSDSAPIAYESLDELPN